MAVYREKDGSWRVIYRYTDWKGERKQTSKRGFITKRDALAWEREQLHKVVADLDMTFGSFVEVYTADMQSRIKENTWETKEHIMRSKLMPYFGSRKISEIQPKEIIAWQNEMLNFKDTSGKAYSPVYLKTLHNQLSCIFNHAVKYYGLTLNPADFDFEKSTVTINKSYQRLKGRDVMTEPKTPKSNRTIKMPQFLCDEMRDYIKSLYGIKPDSRMFEVTKHYLHREMDRGAKASGVKRIRIHDVRHSHISLLIDMGFTAIAIADRVGHESIDITYNYAHLFPSRQVEMADRLDLERAEKGAF